MSGGLRPRTAETVLPGPPYHPSTTTRGQHGRRLLHGPVRGTRALLSQMSGERSFTLGSVPTVHYPNRSYRRQQWLRKGNVFTSRGGACVVKEGGGVWWRGGACMAKGVYMVKGGMHSRRDGHCSGRYASYWNAFLLIYCFWTECKLVYCNLLFSCFWSRKVYAPVLTGSYQPWN